MVESCRPDLKCLVLGVVLVHFTIRHMVAVVWEAAQGDAAPAGCIHAEVLSSSEAERHH